MCHFYLNVIYIVKNIVIDKRIYNIQKIFNFHLHSCDKAYLDYYARFIEDLMIKEHLSTKYTAAMNKSYMLTMVKYRAMIQRIKYFAEKGG